MNKQIKYAFACSSVLFLFCSGVLLLVAKTHADVDTTGYDALALNVAHNNSLLSPHNPAKPPIQPIGFPLFLGLFYKLFGHNHISFVVLQVLLSLICAWLLIQLAQHVFDETTAFFVALLWPLSLGFLIFSQFVLAEIIHTFFIILFVYYFFQSKSSAHLLYASLFAGISLVYKSTLLLFFVPFILFTWIKIKQKSNTKKIMITLVMSVLFFLPMLMHSVRNYVAYQVFAFTPIAQVNLYQVFLAKVIGSVEDKNPQEIIDTQLYCTRTNLLHPAGWQHARTLFFKYLKHHWATVIFLWMKNCGKTLFGLFFTQLKLLVSLTRPPSFFAVHDIVFTRIVRYLSDAQYTRLFYLALFELLWLCACYCFSLIALIHLWVKKQWFQFYFFISFIGVCVMVTGVDGCARYRMAFEPLLIMLSMHGLAIIYSCVRVKKTVMKSGAVV